LMLRSKIGLRNIVRAVIFHPLTENVAYSFGIAA
jgi:hypothetical protein